MKRFCVGVIGLWALWLLFMPASANADFVDSDVALQNVGTCLIPDNPDNCYKPGQTTKICFLVTNASTVLEDIDIVQVDLTFPTGWTLAYNCPEFPAVLDEHLITGNSIAFTPF